MKTCEALVIGGSAGSLDVLLKVLPDLRPDLSFPIIIVIHRKHGADSLLPDLLKGRTTLNVKEVEEKEPILAGTIYVAPSDYHLLIEQVSSYVPDIIFMDNWLPDVGGIDATKELKAHAELSHIPVIYFSANNDVKSLAEQAGADDYLSKPFDIEELEKIISKYL